MASTAPITTTTTAPTTTNPNMIGTKAPAENKTEPAVSSPKMEPANPKMEPANPNPKMEPANPNPKMEPVNSKGSGGSSPTSANPPAQQPAVPTLNGAVKGSKPRPLKLTGQTLGPAPMSNHGGYVHHQNSGYVAYNPQQSSHYTHSDSMSTEDLLELMENINRAVKASQFSPTLAGQIFRLYSQLKTSGEVLEQTHRNELNRVFVSLRQACCRDSGQLGTPCRLKMMELVELRAMGWRPNLAHSQYYLTRSTNGFLPPDLQTGDPMSGGELEQMGAAPVSAPPFGAMSMNPFAFNIPAPMPTAADLVAANQMNQAMGPAPSYYLIPASHVGHPPQGIAFVAPSSQAAMMPPPPMHHPLTTTYSMPSAPSQMNMPNSSPPINFPKGAATKPSGKYSRPTKVPGKNQFRDEVVIRNADSGKIMGVKGRRVAIIEEISKTVISFQKVPQGAKERMLTVTGPTEESIIQSKILIEDTIRRNVSPVRPEGAEGEIHGHVDAETRSTSDGDPDEAGVHANHENGDPNPETEYALAELGSILKLSCSDPAVLQAARQALSEYFHRHEPLRRSATDAFVKQTHKERRKSMPLPYLANVAELVEPESPIAKTAEDLDELNANLNLARKTSAYRSTPNLAAGERGRNLLRATASIRPPPPPSADDINGKDNDDDGQPICRVVYTRDFLLQCAGSANSKMAPPSMPIINEQISEIVPTSRENFDPTAYKQKCVEYKQGRF